MHGDGVYYYASGDIYRGQLYGDKIAGQGRVDLPSGKGSSPSGC